MSLSTQIEEMFAREMKAHGRAFLHYEALRRVDIKHFELAGLRCELRFNPARVHSVMAKTDEKSLASRPCFLCTTGLEEKQLTTLWEGYAIRVNPFPIFAPHFTVSAVEHTPQRIRTRFGDMLRLTHTLQEYTIFYNGPACGASAPDHMHFQAIPIESLPVQRWIDAGHALYETPYFSCAQHIHFTDCAEGEAQFASVWEKLPRVTNEEEPRVNIVSWHKKETWHVVVFARRKTRPDCFFAETDSERILFSPGAVEMSGVGVVADPNSFQRTHAEQMLKMIEEVGLPQTTK